MHLSKQALIGSFLAHGLVMAGMVFYQSSSVGPHQLSEPMTVELMMVEPIIDHSQYEFGLPTACILGSHDSATVLIKTITKSQPIKKHSYMPPASLHKVAYNEPSLKAQTNSSSIKNVQVIHQPPPHYPDYARHHHLEGTVWLRIKINHDGNIQDLHILKSSGTACLDASAMEGIYRWQFAPFDQDAQNANRTIDVPVEYKLEHNL